MIRLHEDLETGLAAVDAQGISVTYAGRMSLNGVARLREGSQK